MTVEELERMSISEKDKIDKEGCPFCTVELTEEVMLEAMTFLERSSPDQQGG